MYYRDLETNKARMDAHNESLKSAARARLDKVAEKKKANRKAKKEAQA